jgi:hypothetical protein
MTHINNLQAYHGLVGYCTGFGGKYNPGRQNLRLEALQAQLEAVSQSLEQVKVTKVHFIQEVNERKKVFNPLAMIASNVLRTLEESGATTEQLASARMLVKGIRKHNKPRMPLPAAGQKQVEEPARRSTLQQSYWAKSDAFSQLVKLVASIPTYQPSVSELSIEGLTMKMAELDAINMRVSESRVKWSQAMSQRTAVMYADHDSAHNRVKSVKTYLSIMLGSDSEQFDQVKRLKFTKIH